MDLYGLTIRRYTHYSDTAVPVLLINSTRCMGTAHGHMLLLSGRVSAVYTPVLLSGLKTDPLFYNGCFSGQGPSIFDFPVRAFFLPIRAPFWISIFRLGPLDIRFSGQGLLLIFFFSGQGPSIFDFRLGPQPVPGLWSVPGTWYLVPGPSLVLSRLHCGFGLLLLVGESI